MAKITTLAELTTCLFYLTPTYEGLFGTDEPTLRYAELCKLCHPDTHPGDKDAEAAFKKLSDIFNGYKPVKPSFGVIPTKNRTYDLCERLATGDLSDVFLAKTADGYFVCKVSRFDGADKFLETEYSALKAIHKNNEKPPHSILYQLIAKPVDSFLIKGKFTQRVTVFEHDDRLVPVQRIRNKFPTGLPGVHTAWLFNRLIQAIRVTSDAGYVNGAIFDPHVLIDPGNHGIKLLGWPHAVKAGQKMVTLPTAYKDKYPPEVVAKQPVTVATDIYLAAQFVSSLTDKSDSAALEPAFQACLLPGMKMRPDEPERVLGDFRKLLDKVYGPPKFHKLEL